MLCKEVIKNYRRAKSIEQGLTHKLFTLDNRLIIRQAGILADADRQAVSKAFNQLFDINA